METDFFIYSRQIIAQDKEKGNSDIANYRNAALTSLSRFLGKERVAFSELSSEVIGQFIEWLLSKGRKETTARLYGCQINVLYKEAVKNGIAPNKQLLKGLRLTMPPKTERKLLSVDELRRMRYADLSNSRSQTLARDIFFQYLLPWYQFYRLSPYKEKRHQRVYTHIYISSAKSISYHSAMRCGHARNSRSLSVRHRVFVSFHKIRWRKYGT